jgi:transposase-like protein
VPVTGGAPPGETDVRIVDVDALLPADSPRLAGESEEHARSLAASDAVLPPILVHRDTMRVVDGMHRLRAAVLRGQRRIAVRFVAGSEPAIFVLAVEANITHGLPLSLADREAAAIRILGSHPHWSDRTIAASTGLSARTVGKLRRRSGAAGAPMRVGKDGRARPVDSAEGRRRAGEMIASNPGASLREIARAVGVSPGTVRDVRNRMSRGQDPVTDRQRAAVRVAGPPPVRDPAATLRILRRDPTLRFSDRGRAVLRWLEVRAVVAQERAGVVAATPPHCRALLAEFARGCADSWQAMAEALDRDADDSRLDAAR